MSEFNLKLDHAIGMDYIIAGFTTDLTRVQFNELQKEAESNRKSVMLNVLENGNEVPCKVIHRTTAKITKENAENSAEKLIEKLVFLTDPVVATAEEEDDRTEDQIKLLIESASFMLDYLVEAYDKIDMQILTIVPDGTSPDDCDELTFGCGMKLIENAVTGNITVETILIMPNIVPFFWRDGRVVYDTESKADVSDEYLRGMIRLLDPIIPKKLTDKLEYFYTAYGYSCNDRTDTFFADLETDTMYLPRLEEDTELPLAYAMREYDLFCVVMPSELVDDTDNLDEAIMSETSHIHEEAYGEEDEDEDSEEDEEDTDDEEDEIEDDDDSDEEEADKKPAALN